MLKMAGGIRYFLYISFLLITFNYCQGQRKVIYFLLDAELKQALIKLEIINDDEVRFNIKGKEGNEEKGTERLYSCSIKNFYYFNSWVLGKDYEKKLTLFKRSKDKKMLMLYVDTTFKSKSDIERFITSKKALETSVVFHLVRDASPEKVQSLPSITNIAEKDVPIFMKHFEEIEKQIPVFTSKDRARDVKEKIILLANQYSTLNILCLNLGYKPFQRLEDFTILRERLKEILKNP